MKLTQTEPVVMGSLPAMILSTALSGLAVFNVWHPTDDQVAWLNGAIAVLIAVGTWFVGRRNAYSPATVARVVAEAEAKVPPETAVALAEARGRASVADQIVAKLGPPPADVPPRSMAAGVVPRPAGDPPVRT